MGIKRSTKKVRRDSLLSLNMTSFDRWKSHYIALCKYPKVPSHSQAEKSVSEITFFSLGQKIRLDTLLNFEYYDFFFITIHSTRS